MFSGFLIAIGTYVFIYYLYDNLRTPFYLLYNTWLQRHKPQQIHLMEKYGKWAAVTGSTAGIGKAYAREFASLGFNVVLISRSEAKLKAVAQEIDNDFGVETFIIQCDFAKGAEIYNSLFKNLAEKPIGILVNNVGMAHDPGTISTFSPEHMWDVINVNIGASTQLSRHFIYNWQKSGKKGLIVNISSGLEQHPCPYGSVYGGSKAYIRSLTQALQEETKHTGISIQLCSPNFVITELNSFSKTVMKGHRLLIPQPHEYAKWAVSTLGKVDETTGFFWHGVMNTIFKVFPYRLRIKFIGVLTGLLVDNIATLENITDTNKK